MNTERDGRINTRYKRLSGRGPRKQGIISASFSRCSLYLADDHILAVDNHIFSEDYKRFYFTDIQAIITRKTRRGGISSIVLAFVFMCSIVAALFLANESVRIFSWTLSTAFLAFFVISIVRGPTCICHIVTAVQVEQLPSLNRLRVARKVIGTLRQRIEKVQGSLSPEHVNTLQNEVINPPTPSPRGLRRPRARKRHIRHYDGTLHMIAFAFILADGILIGIALLHHTSVMSGVSTVVGLIYCICTVIALAKQHESDIPVLVRRMTWASLGFICISSFASYLLTITLLMTQRPKVMMTDFDMYRAMLDLSPRDSPFVMAFYIFSATCSLMLGALGLIRVKKHRDHSASASGRGLNLGSQLRV